MKYYHFDPNDPNHVHEHTHVHTHDGSTHEHTHVHSCDDANHTHDINELHLPNKEMQTLYALLDHWVDHNISHQDGFREWAAKADQFEQKEAAEHIRKAIEIMDGANEELRLAKKAMK